MSLESEILRIQHNIADTYATVASKGGEVPLQPDSAHLAEAVESIPQEYAGEVYSTGEARIGTWIDGKPLYRKSGYIDIGVIEEVNKDITKVLIPGEGAGKNITKIDAAFHIFHDIDSFSYDLYIDTGYATWEGSGFRNELCFVNGDLAVFMRWTAREHFTVSYSYEYTKTTGEGG